MATRARARGFTLVEVLVALAVFAVVGLMSAQLMSRTLANHEVLGDRSLRLAEVQRAMLILKRDLVQINGRSVRDLFGDPLPPVMIGADGMMEFSRAGWRNPLNSPRAEMQRVAYRIHDGHLHRAWWSVLDRAQDSEPVVQRLLSDVDQAEFFALDTNGDEHSFWPNRLGDCTPGGHHHALGVRTIRHRRAHLASSRNLRHLDTDADGWSRARRGEPRGRGGRTRTGRGGGMTAQRSRALSRGARGGTPRIRALSRGARGGTPRMKGVALISVLLVVVVLTSVVYHLVSRHASSLAQSQNALGFDQAMAYALGGEALARPGALPRPHRDRAGSRQLRGRLGPGLPAL